MIEWNGRKVRTARVFIAATIALGVSHLALATYVGQSQQGSLEEQRQIRQLIQKHDEADDRRLKAELSIAKSDLADCQEELRQAKETLEQIVAQQSLARSSSSQPSGEFYEVAYAADFYGSWDSWCECVTRPQINSSRAMAPHVHYFPPHQSIHPVKSLEDSSWNFLRLNRSGD